MLGTHWDSISSAGRTPLVAIAGGGAAGTLAAVHLLCRAGPRIRPRVVIIDEGGRHGRGVAYSTPDPAHLLNTPAAAMSAYAGDPGHLVRWAAGLGLLRGGGDFLSRYAYGDYLRDTLAEQELRHGGLELRTDRVVALDVGADGRPVIGLAAHPALTADAVILATGHLPPAPGRGDAMFAAGAGFRSAAGFPPDVVLPPHAGRRPGDDGRYVADPWSMPPGPVDGDVLLIGTGLTMIDIAVSLTRDNPGITVHAVSRHGLLPHAHDPVPAQPAPPDLGIEEQGPGLARLARAVRAAVEAEAEGDWRAAVDGLRPRVPELWQALSVPDRRRFLDRLARYWEVHRHRMPYPTAQLADRLRAEGRLRIHRGAVRAAESCPAGVRVLLSGGRRLDVARVIRCTGPGGDVTVGPGLAATLVRDGIARPDPLRLGLDTDEEGALLGPYGDPYDRIFTLGPSRRGALYESTAVPEIRVQAERLAARVTTLLTAQRRPQRMT